MTDGKKKVGEALRFIASGGMADEDAGVVADLLDGAHRLATSVLADPGASVESRTLAQNFLAHLSADTYGDEGE